MTEPIEAPHSLTFQEVLRHFDVTLEDGLSNEQIRRQREKFGKNVLDEAEQKSLLALILEQFEDSLVRILLVSALVSFFLAFFDAENVGHGIAAYVEPIVILTILVLNAIVGVWQESNATKALEALKKLAPDTAFVLRAGHWGSIDAEDLVPGDIVEVKVGDKVPADIRLIKLKTTNIRIEQSQLTGESESVAKDVMPVAEENCVIQSKVNMLFSSTTVSNGACCGVVVATGMSTEIGIIQSAVQDAAEEEEQTPLQKKLDDFGSVLAKLIMVICILVWAINYKHFFDPVHGGVLRGCIYYFKIAVALAVAAIPEGLPAVITTCLALGTRQMARRKAIVRKLPSVETLGCTTVICSDKTGTLTTNQMCVVRLSLPNMGCAMRTFEVEGNNYAPVGKVKNLAMDWESDKALEPFAKACALCNESRLIVDDSGTFVRSGEPTEAAIRVLVEKLGCSDEMLQKRCLQKTRRGKADAMAFSDHWTQGVTKRAVLEFNRHRKSMGVIWYDHARGENVLYVKGAPELLIQRCCLVLLPDGSLERMSEEWIRIIEQQILFMASSALRTIGVAMKTDLFSSIGLHDYDGESHRAHSFLGDPENFIEIETDMIFLGMVGIRDPPRAECKDAIEACRVAGISVIMITGDNKVTAEAIAKELGILRNSRVRSYNNSFTGQEFEDMDDGEKRHALASIMERRGVEGAVFSRTEPKHKQSIVKILKSLGEITAMTGDGVNDAPALKQADIGIAMGIAGTEVAKEASDMVLQDDNFSTIVAAVEEGRSIYNNMKAFIRYMISSNVGEVAAIFFTAALGIPEGLTPVQLLWVNLVTDGPPATALGFNPPDLDVMIKPPRRKDDNLISNWSFVRYFVVGMYVGSAVVGIFVYWYVAYEAADGHTLIPLSQLLAWGECDKWVGFKPNDALGISFAANPCAYFTYGKVKASTFSLTVLVVIEMLNAFNALSEDGSLLQMPPWKNLYLILAASFSIGVHLVILYVPVLAEIFGVCPLDLHDWGLVMAFSSPVLLIDEVLKFVGRRHTAARLAAVKKVE